MKTLLKTIIILLCTCGLFSCDDEDNEGQITRPGDPLAITVSSENIELEEAKNDQVAVTFSWNKGLEHPAEDAITYIFRIDVANNNFQTSTEPEEIPIETGTKSFTHKELNDLIIGQWKKSSVEIVDLEARIVAKVSGPKFVYPEIATVQLKVDAYDVYAPPYSTVYLIGNATSAVWEINNAIEMNWNPSTPHLFTISTTLNAGELKMHTAKDWGSNCYRPLVADGSIRETTVQVYPGGDDLKWLVKEDEAGEYQITLDVRDLTILFEKQ